MTDINITDAIFSVAAKCPHAVAIIDGETVVSYRTLCHGVCAAAKRFQQAGWQAGDIVGISLGGSQALHLLVALALARMGIAQVSLPAGDPVPLTRSRIQKLDVRGLVCGQAPVAESRITTVVAQPNWLADAPNAGVADDFRAPGGDRVWIIAETSGTTAEPKVIAFSHAIEDLCRQRLAPDTSPLPGERFLNLTGMHFLTGITPAIRCLSAGAAHTFPPAGLNTDQWLRWIDRHHVTYINCVPLHLHQLLRDIHTDSPRLPSLRMLRSGTSALAASTLNEVRRRISPNVFVSYGTSETHTIVAATPAMLAEHPDTIGRPLAGVELEVVDDLDRPLPAGANGHVRVRGPGILSTYLRASPEDQARVFRNGWCYPGDLGVKSEAGLVFLKGRADDVMNFDGIMIVPGEIESVLGQHSAVAEAAAFPLPSPEHQDIPAAAVVSSQPLDFDELTRFCADRLGVRAPRVLFQIDEIPKNPMGKVLRRRLTELALARLQEKAKS